MRRAAIAMALGAMIGCAQTEHAADEPIAGTQPSSFRVDRLTAAEASGFRATMRHREVVAFVDDVAHSPIAQRNSLGRTEEGRELPAVIIADPPVRTPAEAHASGKTVFFAFGGIHSGEACGKEALCMLARELVNDPKSPESRAILDGCVLLIAPLYNADGNERVSPDNRRGQNGPELGMGERANADGLDLNRDHMKLASEEARSLAAFLTKWDPHVVFDAHTTNGSYHRYTLTFDGALNPNGDAALLGYTRDEFLPSVSERMERETGYLSTFYGNFDRELTKWGTYSHMPRFNASYVGLRNRIAILSEAYAYATFEDRVRATLAFARECMEKAGEERAEILAMCARADAETVRKGRVGGDAFALSCEIARFDEPITIKSYELARPDPDRYGVRPIASDTERDYTVERWGKFVPSETIARPLGYLIPESHAHVVGKLREHGILVEPLADRLGVTVERFEVESVARAARAYQNVRAVTLGLDSRQEWIAVGEGWTLVRTAQPLGNLVCYLLEPGADDGLAYWDVVEPGIMGGEYWPVLRVVEMSD